jgi:hypothetical protein
MCIARFEQETREAFLDLYTKIDVNSINVDENGTVVSEPAQPMDVDIQF